MNPRAAILPGVLLGIFCLLSFSLLLARPQVGDAVLKPAAVAAAAQNQVNAVNFAGCSISPRYPDAVLQWCDLIEQYAGENGIDPNLISAVMLQESAGRPDAYSKSGAVGLMQVMPRDGKAARFQCKNGPCFSDRPSMEELFDPEYNVAYGAQMLAELIQHYGDTREALRAYGPMDVGYYYADLVLKTMTRYR